MHTHTESTRTYTHKYTYAHAYMHIYVHTYMHILKFFFLHTVNALYGDGVGPDGFYYQSYIYLIAPIQVGILNPIGFFCLEYSLQKAKSVRSKSTVSIRTLFTKTLWNLIINPVINMTLLGLVINLIVSKAVHGDDSNYDTDRNLKGWIKDFLSLLGDAYDACALLYLGICMVGKLKDFNGILVLKSVLLCSAKMLVKLLLCVICIYISL